MCLVRIPLLFNLEQLHTTAVFEQLAMYDLLLLHLHQWRLHSCQAKSFLTFVAQCPLDILFSTRRITAQNRLCSHARLFHESRTTSLSETCADQCPLIVPVSDTGLFMFLFNSRVCCVSVTKAIEDRVWRPALKTESVDSSFGACRSL